LLNSCIKAPSANTPIDHINAQAGDILVLCEGLQGYDNSTITLIKSSTGEVLNNYFTSANPGEYLGDTANDIILEGDTAYIALSTSSIIRQIRVSDGKKIRELKLPENCTPRNISKINNSEICVSCLLRSSIYIINLNDSSLCYEIPVGPQPEGIASYNNYVFSANSAYGDFNYQHPDAETIYVIDINAKKELLKLKSGTNVTEVLINSKRNTLYAVYYNLPSNEDSVGGIIEYNLESYQTLRSWKIRARNVEISNSGDSLYFISQMHKGSSMTEESGVSVLDLNSGKTEMIIQNPNKFDIWYGLSISEFDNSIWICNSKNHINNGVVLVYNHNNLKNPIRTFDVGQNPNNIIFIR
jgi:hypothetical protein